jgi:RibD C-terminal domain
MSAVFTALATSADGYITGPGPSPDQALGRGGGVLFDWYFNGDTPSRQFDGCQLSAASAEVFDTLAAPAGSGTQTFVATGIADAIAAARAVAGGRDVALMGSGMIRAALDAGLLDEVVIHQVPVLLGDGTPLFQPGPTPDTLRLRSVVPAPGVTHLHYDVQK